ncbi:hypothetical protein HZB02_05060 [Candidatus Woesearchaeota archaeon]|nr:hypothetical protein [Candidatus Woesearchaeota archaeon]
MSGGHSHGQADAHGKPTLTDVVMGTLPNSYSGADGEVKISKEAKDAYVQILAKFHDEVPKVMDKYEGKKYGVETFKKYDHHNLKSLIGFANFYGKDTGHDILGKAQLDPANAGSLQELKKYINLGLRASGKEDVSERDVEEAIRQYTTPGKGKNRSYRVFELIQTGIQAEETSRVQGNIIDSVVMNLEKEKLEEMNAISAHYQSMSSHGLLKPGHKRHADFRQDLQNQGKRIVDYRKYDDELKAYSGTGGGHGDAHGAHGGGDHGGH